MKIILLLMALVVVGPQLGWGQGALRVDPAGNPVTSFNIGGGNVTGTLDAARLPAGARPPIVQTISVTTGVVTLAAGTNVVVLGTALTGPLNLTLPASASYTAGRALVVVDPGGYSDANRKVTVTPAVGNTLNGGTAALACLQGTGAASVLPDGATRWIVGQSLLRAPDSKGLTVTAPTNLASGTLLSVRDGNGAEAFGVRGDSDSIMKQLIVLGAMNYDDGNIYSDGEANLTVVNTVTTPVVNIRGSSEPDWLYVPAGQVTLFLGEDGRLHCLTADRVDHVLTWSEP